MANVIRGLKRIVWIISIAAMVAIWAFLFSAGDLNVAPFYNITLNSILVVFMGVAAFGLIWLVWLLSRWIAHGFSETISKNEFVRFTIKVLIAAIIFGLTVAIVMNSVKVKTEYQDRGGGRSGR